MRSSGRYSRHKPSNIVVDDPCAAASVGSIPMYSSGSPVADDTCLVGTSVMGLTVLRSLLFRVRLCSFR